MAKGNKPAPGRGTNTPKEVKGAEMPATKGKGKK